MRRKPAMDAPRFRLNPLRSLYSRRTFDVENYLVDRTAYLVGVPYVLAFVAGLMA
jgi:hypothetical protein